MAFANPYNGRVRVWVDYLVEGLEINRQMEIVIPAKSQRTILLSEIAPQSFCCRGLFRFRADFPIPVFSLRLDDLRIASQPVFGSR